MKSEALNVELYPRWSRHTKCKVVLSLQFRGFFVYQKHPPLWTWLTHWLVVVVAQTKCKWQHLQFLQRPPTSWWREIRASLPEWVVVVGGENQLVVETIFRRSSPSLSSSCCHCRAVRSSGFCVLYAKHWHKLIGAQWEKLKCFFQCVLKKNPTWLFHKKINLFSKELIIHFVLCAMKWGWGWVVLAGDMPTWLEGLCVVHPQKPGHWGWAFDKLVSYLPVHITCKCLCECVCHSSSLFEWHYSIRQFE